MDTALPPAQAESAPAGGAELAQVVIATGGALILTVALLVIGLGHRSGRVGLLRWADELSRRVWGNLPGWAGVPAALALVTLLPALFGLAWDEALHIDNGRDPGVADWSIIAFGIGVAAFVLARFAGAGYCLVRIARATPPRKPRPPLAELPDAATSPRPSILAR